jgi:ribonuclease R
MLIYGQLCDGGCGRLPKPESSITVGQKPGQEAGALPEISVLEILGFDDDGNGQARPVDDNAAAVSEICVRLSRRSGRAPAVGQQILARLTQIGPTQYEAAIIRVLDRQPKRLFGIAVATGKKFLITPATRGKRDQLNLIVADGETVRDGDLVEGGGAVRPRRNQQICTVNRQFW